MLSHPSPFFSSVNDDSVTTHYTYYRRRHNLTLSILLSDGDDSRSMPPRPPRRMTSRSSSTRTTSPVSNYRHSPQQPSPTLDVELAKGLRDFFREIKDVQERLIDLREGNSKLSSMLKEKRLLAYCDSQRLAECQTTGFDVRV